MLKDILNKTVKPAHAVMAVLIVLISILTVVLLIALSDRPHQTPHTSTDPIVTTDPPTTESKPDFELRPSRDVDVQMKDKTITLYIREGATSVNFGELISAKENWSLIDSDKNRCENGILPITKDGEKFTLTYGDGVLTVYLVEVYYQKTFNVTYEGLDYSVRVKNTGLASAPEDKPEKTGYTFAGWDFDFNTPITKDTLIPARWTPNTYQVSFHANGGTVSVEKQDVTFGTTVELPIPTKAGFNFVGWFDGDIHVSSGPWTLAKDVTLFAVWDTHDYRITYDANGGSVDKTIQGISYGESFTPPIPKRSGYTFVGWYADGKAVNTSAYSYTTDMTFVAEWLENRYSVEYETNGGNPISGNSVLYSEIGETIPVRPGYTFGGWFFNADLNETNVVVGEGGIVKVYAWWSEENKACDFDYELTDEGVVITGYHATRSICVVPTYIDGQSVVAIGSHAFEDAASLSHIELPVTVTSLGDYAFSGAVKLKKINPIENTSNDRLIDLTGITHIGAGVFSGCTFDTIMLPEGITHLSDYLFENCQNLVSVDMTHITSAGKGVFKGCTSLTEIHLPSSITSLGDDFFRGCVLLADLTLPTALSSLGNGVFAECVLLTEITLPTTLTKIGDELFYGCTGLLKINNFTNNSKIKSIGSGAFYGCAKLTGLAVPSGVTAIGANAFNGCLEIKTMTLPAAVTVIEDGTFGGCSYLSTLTVNGKLTKIGNAAFSGCRRLSSLSLTGSLTYLGDEAFKNCLAINGINLTQNLTYLGREAFAGCTKLSAITISSNITEIPDGVFADCTALSTVTWHNGIKTIGERAFYNCRALSVSYMPSSIEVVKTHAFSSCHAIQTLRFEKTLFSIESFAFSDCISLAEIEFTGSGERWKGAVAKDAFEGCDDLKGNISVVVSMVDDLRTSLYSNHSSSALWAIDSTLAMNNQRPAAVIRFRPNTVYYRNLVTVDPENNDPLTSGKINTDYVWKLVLEGEAVDGFEFTTTVTVSKFEVFNLVDGGFIMMDLGERFATMIDLESCVATLEIYGVSNPGKLLYTAELGRYYFEEKKSDVTEDADRKESAKLDGVTLTEGPNQGQPYGADKLFDKDTETKFLAFDRTPITVKLSSPATLGSYSFVTASSQSSYPTAMPVSWTLYGGVLLKDGTVEWVEIHRVEDALMEANNLVEHNYAVSQGSAFAQYKIEFDGTNPIMLSEIWFFAKNR